MATLPPPPAAASAAPVASSAPAAEVTAGAEKTPVAGFGKGRGEGAISVPTVCDFKGLIEAIHAAITNSGADLAGLVTAYDNMPKNVFPGNTEGRACYNLGNVLKNIYKIHSSLHKVKVPKERKVRVKSSDVFKAALLKLASSLGADDAKIRAILGDDAAKLLDGVKKAKA